MSNYSLGYCNSVDTKLGTFSCQAESIEDARKQFNERYRRYDAPTDNTFVDYYWSEYGLAVTDPIEDNIT